MPHSSAILVVALMFIIIMMILPTPSWILDMGLAISFGLSICMFTIALFISQPLEFSVFPTVLLASLVLRLSLNVSSTKLIISEGHTGTDAAGYVIQGFANFVMSGSILLGVVIFCVLMIVNFSVLTKGSARMAEVSARFALDAMPGKQMAIDADISSGAIDHLEAKKRRETEQKETTFYGSLDGVSKFVKGDAIAGLLITALNLILGVIVGVYVHDMPINNALETYSILTVGDGLVTQIPAVIVSIATGFILARGGSKTSSNVEIIQQLSNFPAALMTVACLMALFSFVPGLPFFPFFIASISLFYLSRKMKKRKDEKEKGETRDTKEDSKPQSKTVGDLLDIDDIHVQFSTNLVNLALDPALGLDIRINNMRTHIAKDFGLVLPEIRLSDNPILKDGTYQIKIQDVEVARGLLEEDMVLALIPEKDIYLPEGIDVNEPVYGAPARWIKSSENESAVFAGVTTILPTEVMATHLLEVIKRNLSRLLTLKSLQRLLKEFVSLSNTEKSDLNRKLLNELIPEKVQIDTLHQVLRLLLDEQVSIRNFPLILEAIAETRGHISTPEAICEHVRRRLSFQLISKMKGDDGTVALIQLAPEWEDVFRNFQVDASHGSLDIALPPDRFETLSEGLVNQTRDAALNGRFPAVITSARRRRFLKTVLEAKGIPNPVVSFEEIGIEAKPILVGTVEI